MVRVSGCGLFTLVWKDNQELLDRGRCPQAERYKATPQETVVSLLGPILTP